MNMFKNLETGGWYGLFFRTLLIGTIFIRRRGTIMFGVTAIPRSPMPARHAVRMNTLDDATPLIVASTSEDITTSEPDWLPPPPHHRGRAREREHQLALPPTRRACRNYSPSSSLSSSDSLMAPPTRRANREPTEKRRKNCYFKLLLTSIIYLFYF